MFSECVKFNRNEKELGWVSFPCIVAGPLLAVIYYTRAPTPQMPLKRLYITEKRFSLKRAQNMFSRRKEILL